MKVTLSHCKNPDVTGGYWATPTDPAKATKVQCTTYTEASQLCRAYIERNGLGGGNWSGGRITDDAGKKTHGHVSYNGRVWDNANKEIAI